MTHSNVHVKVVDGLADLSVPDDGQHLLDLLVLLEVAVQVTATCVLHEDENLLAHLEDVIDAHGVRVLHLDEGGNLPREELVPQLGRHLRHVHHLHGRRLVVLLHVDGLVDLAEGTRADLALQLVALPRQDGLHLVVHLCKLFALLLAVLQLGHIFACVRIENLQIK